MWRSERSLSLTDGEPDLSLQLLVTDQGRDAHTSLGNVRPEAVKPDKMEETLTCIICQDLLHDCVRYAPRRGACRSVMAGEGRPRGSSPLGHVGFDAAEVIVVVSLVWPTCTNPGAHNQGCRRAGEADVGWPRSAQVPCDPSGLVLGRRRTGELCRALRECRS